MTDQISQENIIQTTISAENNFTTDNIVIHIDITAEAHIEYENDQEKIKRKNGIEKDGNNQNEFENKNDTEKEEKKENTKEKGIKNEEFNQKTFENISSEEKSDSMINNFYSSTPSTMSTVSTTCDQQEQQQQQQQQKIRQKLALPLRSMTEMNDNNDISLIQSTTTKNQLIQSCSLEASSTKINLKKFKTKRFYETENDDNILMTQIFSQTIRSTSVTPTDECDMNDLIADIANSAQQQQQQQITQSNQSITTTLSNCNYDQKSIPSIKTTPSPPPLALSPTFSSINYMMNDTDNYSATEYSNAESQTDNIEMYNEPNMSSLLDNLHSDCEEFVDKSDTEDTTDPDYNPWDIKPNNKSTGTSTTVIMSTDLQQQQQPNSSSSITNRFTPTLVASTTTATSSSSTTITIPSTSSLSSTLSSSDNTKTGPIKRRPSIVVEFYNDDLTKNLEYEVEGGEILNNNTENELQQLPYDDDVEGVIGSGVGGGGNGSNVSTPTTPIAAAAIAAAKFSYFDTTIEEEDDDEEFNQKTNDNNLELEKTTMNITKTNDNENDDKQKDYEINKNGNLSHQKNDKIENEKNENNEKINTNSIKLAAGSINLHESNGMEKFNNKEIKKVIPSNMRLHDDDLSNIDVKSLKKIYLMEQPPVNRKFKENTKQYHIPLNRSVSVKQLCRSFGDLTAIKAYGSNDNLKRAKSVSDVRSIEIGISVKQLKSSFSKFDALQKKNILHVRSSDAGKAQEKFNDVNSEHEKNCRSCGKIVYKMEEIKAEKNIWHRNCFKCNECGKQLNVDTYQSHESVVYCKPHFKLLFAPKAVENNEPAKPKKPELIIRENQPVELPADVVRASDKPDLGLDELHQLDVKSRFQVFEHLKDQPTNDQQNIERSPSGITRSASILSKLAKFKAKGMDTGVADEALSGIPLENSSSENEDDDDIDENDPDAALIRSKRMQKERPMSFSNMNDIKSKFEKGHVMTREERREERKQEIQNIRSRLFMGKQAKIKEMYQQAVAESEHAITSAGKKPEIDIGDKAKSLKEKFEKGEIFNKEDENNEINNKTQDEEMAVFEQGISKKSRSIFMELDASASKPPQLTPQPTTPRSADAKKNIQVSPLQSEKLKPFSSENVVKYDEKPDDIKIETSEISSKFKFFETYKPTEQKKKEFRITPPREGVVKMPSPERDDEHDNDNDVIKSEEKIDDPSVVAQTQTATKMLSLFRQMEQNKIDNRTDEGLKPLKQFTPPPNDNRRGTYENESDDEYTDEEEEGEEEEGEEEQEESENEKQISRYEDEYLKQAKLEARAKQLRAKFEKWEANEIRREMSNGTINVYENADSDSQIESAKSLCAKFESMREQNNISPNRPKIQVNRFV